MIFNYYQDNEILNHIDNILDNKNKEILVYQKFILFS